MQEFAAQQVANFIAIGSIYALIAIGFTLVFGVLQMINFAHSDVMMAGSFAMFTVWGGLVAVAGLSSASYLVVVGVIAVAVLTGGLGVLIERVAYRPLRNTSRLGPLLSSLGVSIVLQNLVLLLYGPQPIAFPAIVPPISFRVLGANVTLIQVVILVASSLLMAGLTQFIHRTRLGVQIRAVAEDRRTAQLLGIDIDGIIRLIFFLGAGLGAVAGILYGSYYGVIQFSMGLLVGLKAFTAAILGGIGSVTGAVLGAYLLAMLEVLGASVLPMLTHDVIGSDYKDVFAFMVLIAVLIFKPTGLLGRRISEETTVYKRDF